MGGVSRLYRLLPRQPESASRRRTDQLFLKIADPCLHFDSFEFPVGHGRQQLRDSFPQVPLAKSRGLNATFQLLLHALQRCIFAGELVVEHRYRYFECSRGRLKPFVNAAFKLQLGIGREQLVLCNERIDVGAGKINITSIARGPEETPAKRHDIEPAVVLPDKPRLAPDRTV